MANRNNTILIKRSNVPGKVPVLTGLTLGELALNISDSKIYTLYTGGSTGATEVRQIGWDRISRTGDTVYGDFNFYGNIQISGLTQPSGYTLSITGDTNLIGYSFHSGNTEQIGNYHITGNTSQEGTYTHSGNTFITGNTTQIGNFNLTGLTELNGLTTVYGNTPNSAAINPGLNNTYDLGNPSYRWREIWTTNIDVSNIASIEYLIVNATSEFYDTANFNNGGINITGTTNQLGDFNLSGNAIIQSGVTASSYNISVIPTLNNTLFQILGRNENTGEVEYRQVNTIGNNVTIITGGTYSAVTTVDNVIGVDTTSTTTTIYLPDSVSSGRLRFEIKDIGLNAFYNPITIIASGSDTIISYVNTQTLIMESEGGAIILLNTGLGQWWQM